ncbi:glycosyltransferase family 39 protein [Thermomicrobiaceae bacterium CFH 74404]|uniref:Glycosyltransferase family 39 protein n=1 Tax=Thermalbibacter longus TaxID=2951981 RepID=A0AA41WIQ3_9BACT|nr:hypothetical protein [Thermalbibacter longus]MCM8750096.1 glycosyltransferase family 39 protein [Thermalbibacter longus]
MAIRERALVVSPPRVRLRGDVHTLVMLIQAIFVAVAVRLYFVLRSDFPLNDGGLFYSMVRDLQIAHYRLPVNTSYNLDGIPFAYPPLAFYVVGLIDSVGPWSLLGVMRFFPVIVSVLGLGAFVLLCQTMLRPKAAIVPAAFVFALLPMAFVWQIMGGGITRSLGQLFSILALWQAYLLYTRADRRHVLWLAILAGCTVLSHPEAAWFTAYSIPLLYLFLARDRRGLINSVLVGLGVLIVTAPWWATVLIRHGISALKPASDPGWPFYHGIVQLLHLDITREPTFTMLGGLALLGAFVCLGRREYLLPAWVLAIHALQPRAADQRAVIPLAMLAGIGIIEVVLPLLARVVRATTLLRSSSNGLARGVAHFLLDRTWLLQVTLLALTVQSAASTAYAFNPLLTGLSPDERAAMEWAATSTLRSSPFIVITGEPWFGQDKTSEWFPALTQRVSVDVVQGYEWVGGFAQRIARHEQLQACATQNSGCLENWALEHNIMFSYVYVTRRPANIEGVLIDRTAAIQASLRSDPRYVVVYDGPGAVIFRRVGNP